MSVRNYQCPRCRHPIRAFSPASHAVICAKCRWASRIEAGRLRALEGPLPAVGKRTLPLESKLQLYGISVTVCGVVEYHETGGTVTTVYELTGSGAKHVSLEQEDGVWTLYRRLGQSARLIRTHNDRSVEHSGKHFEFEGTYHCRVTAAVGEFDELPEIKSRETYKYYEGDEHDLVCEIDADKHGNAWYTAHEPDDEELQFVSTPGLTAWQRLTLDTQRAGAGTTRQIVLYSALFAAAAAVIHFAFAGMAQNKLVYQSEVKTASRTEAPWTTEPFRLEGRTSNVLTKVSTNLNNQWLDMRLTLVDTSSGKWYQRHEDLEYFSGVEGGEYWSEGGREHEIYFSSVPAGEYKLEVQGFSEHPNVQYRLTLLRDVPDRSYLLYALAAFGALPLIFLLRRMEE